MYCPSCEEVKTLYKTISNSSSKIEALSKENKNFQKLTDFYSKGEQIIQVVEHNQIHFVVTQKQTINHMGLLSEFELYGYVLESFQPTFVGGSWMAHMRCTPCFDKNLRYLKSIFINDFGVSRLHRDRGYGGILMKHLIRYAEKLNVEYIRGVLSFQDIGNGDSDMSKADNRERLYHFYPKYGFIITDNKEIYRPIMKQD